MNISAPPADLPRDFYVYEHRKATTGEVFYVGKGKGLRAWSIKQRSEFWGKKARKHGVHVFIVMDGLQEWAAFELEKDRIALHGCIADGSGSLCNMNLGGAGGALIGDALQRMRESVSRTTKGVPPTQAVMNASKLAWLDPEKKAARSAAIKAALADPEIKAKQGAAISAAQVGKMKSPEHRLAIQRALGARKVRCVELNLVFPSMGEAALWVRMNGRPSASSSAIFNSCNNTRPRAYGYTWRYAE